jgi:ribosome-associated translation inhibitor RaiA
VRIGKLKGEQGTGERRCHIEARLVPFGTVAFKDRGTDLFAAIDRAAGRMARLIAHRVERTPESKTGGASAIE